MTEQETDVLSTQEFYDALAPVYDRELVTRGSYAKAINEIILAWVRKHECQTILDLGCANGWRLKGLVEATGAKGIGVDLSPEMVQEARRRGVDAFVRDIADAAFAPLPVAAFDLIICTWCIGHLRDRQARLNALRTVRSLLAPTGSLIIDVNNPLNAAEYGWSSVARNVTRAFLRVPGAGDFVTRRMTSERELATRVHLFTRAEILGLLSAAGLRPVNARYVNYATGKDASAFSGQLCLVATAKSG